MRYTGWAIGLFTSFVYGKTASELCRGTAEQSHNGNWYCSEVRAITYRNISQAGAYNQTTSIDPSTGLCGHARLDYASTGPLTPLFGEVQFVNQQKVSIAKICK